MTMDSTIILTTTAVSLAGVHKRYRTGAMTLAALQDVTVDIHADRFTVLSGPSGSGKTTLLNLAGGLDRPDQGRITVGGTDLQALSDDALSDLRRLRIGFIFQNFNLLPTLTAQENVEYPLILNGVGPRQRASRAERMLEEAGLAGHGHKRPGQLSGGQQQRVAIARALVKDPLLVLADEPTANLDSGTSLAILALMRDLQRRHRVAFVFSSHDPQVLAQADDLIVIRDGRVAHRQVQSGE